MKARLIVVVMFPTELRPELTSTFVDLEVTKVAGEISETLSNLGMVSKGGSFPFSYTFC